MTQFIRRAAARLNQIRIDRRRRHFERLADLLSTVSGDRAWLERVTAATIKLHRPFHRPLAGDPFMEVGRRGNEMLASLHRPAVLEIGARNVTGQGRRDRFPNAGEYVGVDVLPGENVDVVGDAHQLSSLVKNDHFDVVFSAAVYEHLMYPWKVAIEANKVLKTSGIMITMTNPAWPEHEMPWDFWRFPKMSFHSMFNVHTGFEILELAEGVPMKIYLLNDLPNFQPLQQFTINTSVGCIARKIGPVNEAFLRWDLHPSMTLNTLYPAGTGKSKGRENVDR
jgi:hypothetical protein